MKSDLDRLMAARGLDAIVIASDHNFSAPRAYLTNGADMSAGLIIKKRGDAPVIFCNPMEVEEAARSGLTVYTFYDLGWAELVQALEGDRTKAEVIFWARCLEKIGARAGKVGIYGVSDLNIILALTPMLKAAHPQYEFAGELGTTLFDEAYMTKDADEIARLRAVADKTCRVLEATWDYVASQQTQDGGLVRADGAPVTIGDVRRFVRRTLLDYDLEDTGMIFAQGRDGGFPHSRGEDGEQLRLGTPVVFDLFPREIGGGYFHDVTRTWSLGYATPDVQQAYDQVMEAHDVAVETARSGMPAKAVQEAVLDYFEGKGHPTLRSHPSTTVGYTHGLGHGVGLKIHERPSIGHLSKDMLQPGNVFTIEPGLYYPERGFGMRVEDTCYLDESGALASLTTFRKDLVVPVG